MDPPAYRVRLVAPLPLPRLRGLRAHARPWPGHGQRYPHALGDRRIRGERGPGRGARLGPGVAAERRANSSDGRGWPRASSIVGAYWTWQGPLQPGWNTIANDGHGSGGAIVAVAAADPTIANSAQPSASPTASPAPPQAFSDALSGQLAQADDGSVVLSATLQSSGDQLAVRFQPADDGQMLVEGATVTLLAPDGDQCAGQVQGADDNGLSRPAEVRATARRGCFGWLSRPTRTARSRVQSGRPQGEWRPRCSVMQGTHVWPA